MNFGKLLKNASEKASPEKMKEWGDLFENLMETIKESHPDLYKKYYIEFYKINFGEHLDECLAKYWVDNMISSTGFKGEKFTKQDSDEIAKQLNLSFDGYNDWDWCAILNMVWSDYSQVIGNNMSMCQSIAKATIEDVDVKNKAFNYFFYVVK